MGWFSAATMLAAQMWMLAKTPYLSNHDEQSNLERSDTLQ